MSSREYVASGLPWYHFFWPWFLVILLSLSVIGSLWTVSIAYQHRDVDVRIRPAATEISAEAAVREPVDSRNSGK